MPLLLLVCGKNAGMFRRGCSKPPGSLATALQTGHFRIGGAIWGQASRGRPATPLLSTPSVQRRPWPGGAGRGLHEESPSGAGAAAGTGEPRPAPPRIRPARPSQRVPGSSLKTVPSLDAPRPSLEPSAPQALSSRRRVAAAITRPGRSKSPCSALPSSRRGRGYNDDDDKYEQQQLVA